MTGRQLWRTLARSPLRLPAFRRLWFGLLVSGVGDQFTIIALLWFVLDLTGSGTDLGIVVFCFGLPGILTGPLLGMALDRLQPRLVMAVDNVLRALVIAAIPALYWLDRLDLGLIFALAAIAGALTPATVVGTRVLLPRIVTDAELVQANAWLSFATNAGVLGGPFAAGLLVAWLGGPAALLVDAATFALMAALLLTLPNITRRPLSAAEAEARGRARWLGFDTLLRLPAARTITALSLVFFFSYGPLEPALPIYTRDTLDAGAAGFGLLWSGFGVGAVLGLLAIPTAARLPRPGIVVAAIAILWGALLLPLALLSSLPLAMLFFALAGAAWAPYTTVEVALIQRLTPQHLHGQLFGARYTLLTAAFPLGAAAGGLLLDALSAPEVIALSALACIASGLGGLCSPALRSIRRTPPVEVEPAPSPVPIYAEEISR